MFEFLIQGILSFFQSTGIYKIISAAGSGAITFGTGVDIGTIIMIGVACFLIYLAIGKKYEPLLLLPIAFGMLLANMPGANLLHNELFVGDGTEEHFVVNYGHVLQNGGLLDLLYMGVKLGIYPSLIFLGIGTMTDFAPLIANPKSLMLGAAAQLGVFVAFLGALLIGFSIYEAFAIGIIGGADGPTAILVTKTTAPSLLPAIAIAAYSYMALIPIIQPRIMKLLTTKKERSVKMSTLRPVSRIEKLLFPIIVTVVVAFIVPDAIPLVGMLMLGNLIKESGVADRLSKTAQNELMNIVTIFLGTTVGATASAGTFLKFDTIFIILLGLVAFSISTAGGLLGGKVMYILTKGKINPLIGSAGVSAVPMAARVAQNVGQKEVPTNYLLMHAMGPNVAGVIGSAVAAGVFLTFFKIL